MSDYAIHDTTLTGIANTIRKKDGTQALIDPADYADRINLMGMLEEKTASGAVSVFGDGSDAVPLSSWVINVDANLTGKSQIIATHGKKNLIDNSASAWEQGNINTSGANSVGNEYVRTVGYYEIKGGASYEISGIATPSTTSDFRLFFYDASKTFISYKNYGSTPRTVPENACYFRLRNIGTGDMTNLQIEYGSTATTFAEYSAPVINTVNLGRTVYGGQADVVNGTGVETWDKVVYTGAQDEAWALNTSGGVYRFYIQNNNVKKPESGRGIIYSSIGQYAASGNTEGTCFSAQSGNNTVIYYVPPQTVTTAEEFKEWLSTHNFDVVYEKATSTSFTFDAISPVPESYLGYNSLWGDTGDSSVVYRSSGTITPIVPVLTTKSITENGTYNASSDNADGYSQVTVSVQPNVGTKNITENGTYTASTDNLDGYSSVNVAVPTAPSGMVVMDFANINSPFTLNGVSYGATGAVFDNTSDYIDLPFFHAGMEIEIDVASISLGQNANRRFLSSYRNQGFLYRNSNVWSFYNGSWYDTNISDSGYFDNSTVKIVVDSNNYWHIYKDDVLIFEPAGACAISEPAIGSKDGSCINNAIITGIRMREVTA